MTFSADTHEFSIRSITDQDAERCGQVAFDAHREVAARHGYAPEQPSADFATALIRAKLADPNAKGVLAESHGAILGSAFLNTFGATPVAAIGPLTVHPDAPGGVGRALMTHVMELARQSDVPSVRLVQSPNHLQSLALYAKMGFDVREPLVLVQGRIAQGELDVPADVRAVGQDDVPNCMRLGEQVIGVQREMELRRAIAEGVAALVERGGRLVGYATGIGMRGHAVAETTADLLALIAGAPQLPGPGFFAPVRNGELLRKLLARGARLGWPAALMSRGRFELGKGAFLPSIAY
jgi:predicted N-acetyltransferase YhbS